VLHADDIAGIDLDLAFLTSNCEGNSIEYIVRLTTSCAFIERHKKYKQRRHSSSAPLERESIVNSDICGAVRINGLIGIVAMSRVLVCQLIVL